MAASPELETALRAVVREPHGLLHSDAALCTTVDLETRRLRMLTGIGTRTDGIAGYEVKAGEGAVGVVLTERRSVRSDDYLTDPRFGTAGLKRRLPLHDSVAGWIIATLAIFSDWSWTSA
jgi:hypothetical protein